MRQGILKLLIVVTLCFFSLSTLGQQSGKVQMTVKVNSSKMQDIRIYKYGVSDQLQGSVLDTIIPIQPYQEKLFLLYIPQEGVYGIQDNILSTITHQIFLSPGDAVKLVFDPRSEKDKEEKDAPHVLTHHRMTAIAKYPGNFTFFDSIAKKIPLKYGRIKGESLQEYKERCDSIYKIWTGILEKMVQQKKVSNDFIPYAKAVLSAKHVTWLAGPASLLPRNAFPHDYFVLPDSIRFDQDKYMQSLPGYGQAAFLKNKYFNGDDKNNREYSGLKRQFSDIIKNHTGIVRDQLMAIKIRDYARKDDPYFDTAYTLFQKLCSSLPIKKIAQEAVTASIIHAKESNQKMKWEDVPLHTLLYDTNGELTTLKQIANDPNKLYLIDCWATWCAPCRVQLPYLKQMEKKYKKQIKVISISFDQEKKRWNSFLKNKEKKLANSQYRVYHPRESALINFFDIHTIPRYILLSRGGEKILEADMPLPSLTKWFEKKLEKYF